jgi:hypothetical protein
MHPQDFCQDFAEMHSICLLQSVYIRYAANRRVYSHLGGPTEIQLGKTVGTALRQAARKRYSSNVLLSIHHQLEVSCSGTSITVDPGAYSLFVLDTKCVLDSHWGLSSLEHRASNKEPPFRYRIFALQEITPRSSDNVFPVLLTKIVYCPRLFAERWGILKRKTRPHISEFLFSSRFDLTRMIPYSFLSLSHLPHKGSNNRFSLGSLSHTIRLLYYIYCQLSSLSRNSPGRVNVKHQDITTSHNDGRIHLHLRYQHGAESQLDTTDCC